MNLYDAFSMLIIMLTLAIIPSTSVALVVTRSATLGISNGAAVAAGIVFGDLMFVLLAILGLTMIAELMGTFFLIIKYLAGLYLIWLGLTLIRDRHQVNVLKYSNSSGGLAVSFLSGLLLTLGDVKAIFFYASLFPSYVEISALGSPDILLIVLITIIAVGGVKLAYAFEAKKIAHKSKRFKLEKEAKVGAGVLMLGSGSYLIAKA